MRARVRKDASQPTVRRDAVPWVVRAAATLPRGARVSNPLLGDKPEGTVAILDALARETTLEELDKFAAQADDALIVWDHPEPGVDALAKRDFYAFSIDGATDVVFGSTYAPPEAPWLTILKAPAKYDHIDFKPPQGVASAAAKGLEYRKKAGGKGGLSTSQAAEQGVGSGVARAASLKNRQELSPDTVRRMKAFFDRHEQNKGVAPEHRGEPWKDKGHVAWLLWGGDPGRAWANKVVGQMDAADKKSKADKAILLKPFAGFEDFDACVAAMQREGHDAEAARRICGALQSGDPMHKQDDAHVESVHRLRMLLGLLRAQFALYQNAHWQVAGDDAYADHLLYQRIYDGDDEDSEGIEGEIDGLGEKIVGAYGPGAVDDLAVEAFVMQWLSRWNTLSSYRAKVMQSEVDMQDATRSTYDRLKELGTLSLGMDDFLMTIASAHETHQFLLKPYLTDAEPPLDKADLSIGPGDPGRLAPEQGQRYRRIRTKGHDEIELAGTATLLKADDEEEEERYILGVVLEPDEVDSQGDTITEEEIRFAAHGYMEKFGNVGLQHQTFVNDKIKILETYIAPADFEIGGQAVKKGTWLMAFRVLDDKIWKAIKDGLLTGLSIGGSGLRLAVS